MKCPYCNSEKTYKNGSANGVQQYKCTNCGKYFRGSSLSQPSKISKIGMSVKDFREKFDVEYIVDKTLKTLDRSTIYEKSDIYKLTGLRAGYPGLAATLEDKKFQDYRGRVGGKDYFSHPDTIKELIETAILQ